MFYLYRQQYQKAAASFDDIAWRGVAYYRAENFKAAVEMFSRIQTADGYFNLGNAYAHARHYLLAVKSYDHALQLAPAHAGARKNREKVQAIIDEINQLSASQQAEEGDSTRELGDDEPQTADGAERKDAKQRKSTPLTADELLMDEALNELWMRQVQKDPSRFLSAKFHMQLQHQGGSPGAP
ncbi:MAG: tetratricopeptide repeat protein [Mariprofundus sp.]